MLYRSKTQVTSTKSALTSSLEVSLPSLRNSHSNYELNKAGIPESPKHAKKVDENQTVFDYYNILVPHLPANSTSKGHDIGLRNKFTSDGSVSKQSSCSTDAVILLSLIHI